MSDQEKIEAAEWLETDAAYLRKQAVAVAARGDSWSLEVAEQISKNADYSASWAATLRAGLVK